jgi:hypothetical protein
MVLNYQFNVQLMTKAAALSRILSICFSFYYTSKAFKAGFILVKKRKRHKFTRNFN